MHLLKEGNVRRTESRSWVNAKICHGGMTCVKWKILYFHTNDDGEQFRLVLLNCLFLGATKHLYNWLCPSVGLSVGLSVGWSGRIRSTIHTSHLLAYLALFICNLWMNWNLLCGKYACGHWTVRIENLSKDDHNSLRTELSMVGSLHLCCSKNDIAKWHR